MNTEKRILEEFETGILLEALKEMNQQILMIWRSLPIGHSPSPRAGLHLILTEMVSDEITKELRYRGDLPQGWDKR